MNGIEKPLDFRRPFSLYLKSIMEYHRARVNTEVPALILDSKDHGPAAQGERRFDGTRAVTGVGHVIGARQCSRAETTLSGPGSGFFGGPSPPGVVE